MSGSRALPRTNRVPIGVSSVISKFIVFFRKLGELSFISLISISTLKIFKGFSTTASRFSEQMGVISQIVSLSILSATYRFPFSKFTLKKCSAVTEEMRNFLFARSWVFKPRSLTIFPTK
ncbi:hypothetical protein XENTR_v10008086 [Xenopus tropicalis]|nr:hypothetical protein XENTR_v10008086 [Xenopus tropicalis]